MDNMMKSREAVILLHGLWLSRLTLLRLSRQLRRAGFETYLFDYRSRHTLARSAARLDTLVQRVRRNGVSSLHFVGHSLGGIVIRAYFDRYDPLLPGRIVTLASPHNGSIAAQVMGRTRLTRWLAGHAVAEIAAGDIEHFRMPVRQIGIIAGTRPIGLAMFFGSLKRPHDGVVNLSESMWAAASASRVHHVGHTTMLASDAVIRLVEHFLRDGDFESSQHQP